MLPVRLMLQAMPLSEALEFETPISNQEVALNVDRKFCALT